MATAENQSHRLPGALDSPARVEPAVSGAPPLGTAPGEHGRRTAEVAVTGGSMIEAIAGIAAVVLAIFGLANVLALPLLSVAVIVVGVGLVFAGAAMAVRRTRLLTDTAGFQVSAAEFGGGGMGIEVLAGLAGIVLGVLALIGLVPVVLNAVAALVFGAALLLSSGGTARLSCL